MSGMTHTVRRKVHSYMRKVTFFDGQSKKKPLISAPGRAKTEIRTFWLKKCNVSFAVTFASSSWLFGKSHACGRNIRLIALSITAARLHRLLARHFLVFCYVALVWPLAQQGSGHRFLWPNSARSRPALKKGSEEAGSAKT